MAWVAVAVAGGALVGGYMSSQAAGNAAGIQAAASDRAAQLQYQEYQQQRADQAPWMAAGQQALGSLTSQLPQLTRSFTSSDFNQDPGYAYRLQQGQQAIERSAASRGGLLSGATAKALDAYSQGQGSQEYQSAYNRFTNDQANTFNRLSSVAGLGQAANAQVGAAGTNMANQAGNDITNGAAAQAAGTVGSANAINSTIGNAGNSWMNYSLMNRMMPSSPTPSYMGGASSYAAPAGGSGFNYNSSLLGPLE